MKHVLTAISSVRPPLQECNITIPKSGGNCGFHLSKTHYDPYPWVSRVDEESPAKTAGLSVSNNNNNNNNFVFDKYA